jgi:hypothetical protein
MTPELIAKVFDLFIQAERASDRSQGGLGIGLALVRSLVLLHGGHVSAESAGLGRGTRFTICLPRLDVVRLPNGIADHADLRVGQSELTILLVDDNEDGLMMMEMLLASMGHRVVATSHPHEVMQRAHDLRPDVCFSISGCLISMA